MDVSPWVRITSRKADDIYAITAPYPKQLSGVTIVAGRWFYLVSSCNRKIARRLLNGKVDSSSDSS